MSEEIQIPLTTDHDVLVALITTFNTTTGNIEKRINEDKALTMEVKQFLEDHYTKLDGRIKTLEQNFQALNPEEIAKLRSEVDRNSLWIHDFNRAKHIAWVIASAGFLLIGYYIPFFLNAITGTIWNVVHMK